jgi:hypothetical protein
MTQDALENLVSSVRGCEDDHSLAIHFRQCLKIMMSQFMDVPKTSSHYIDIQPVKTNEHSLPDDFAPKLNNIKPGPQK